MVRQLDISLIAERAQSECARSMRSVEDRQAAPSREEK
jgi:hypothetical protein